VLVLADQAYVGLLTLAKPTDGGRDSLSHVFLVSTLLKTMTSLLAGMRQAAFACLLVSLVGAGFSAVSAIPAIFFPHSQLLAYFNIFWPFLASVVVFVAAILLTVLISGVFAVAGEIINVAGAGVRRGTSALLIVWLAWFLVSLSVVYWGIVWFVEVRQSSFTRRKRSDDEVGNWKNIGKEIRSDLKGSKIL
jgi:hypothetical protein